MQEPGVAHAEASAVGRETWRWHWRIAVARVMVEDGRLVGFDIVTRSLEAIVIALPFNRLKIHRGRRRRCVDRLRMRTAGQKSRRK